MASITISDPQPNTTVGWTFTACGGYVTTPTQTLPETGENKIVCTLYDSAGQPIQVQTVTFTGRVPRSGTWSVGFTVDQDYPDCSITAELILDGAPPPPPSATVTGIDVSAGAAPRSRECAAAQA